MLIFLYGPDSYRRQKKQQQIVAEYRKKHSALTIERFDIADDGVLDIEEWERLHHFIKNQSLFDPHTLAIVRGVFVVADTPGHVAWFRSLRDVTGVTAIISADSAPPKPFSFLTQKPIICNEFKPLDGWEFKKFAEAEAASRGAPISDRELAELHALYRNDVWGFMTELDTIALLPRAPLPPHLFSRRDFFVLIKDIAYGSGSRALSALEELLHDEDPAKIFNMLAAVVSGDQKIRMADYDVAVKSGVLDYEAALLDFAIR